MGFWGAERTITQYHCLAEKYILIRLMVYNSTNISVWLYLKQNAITNI